MNKYILAEKTGHHVVVDITKSIFIYVNCSIAFEFHWQMFPTTNMGYD